MSACLGTPLLLARLPLAFSLTLQKILGHDDIKATLTYYVYVTEEMEDKTAKIMSKALGKKFGTKFGTKNENNECVENA